MDFRPREEVRASKGSKLLSLNKYALATTFYIHESYTSREIGSIKNDIAIIEFPKNTNFGVGEISLAKNYQADKGDRGIAAGYGRIDIATNCNGLYKFFFN